MGPGISRVPWADPTVTAIGRLSIAPPTTAYRSVDEARASDLLATADGPWQTSLNGRWKLRLFDHPDRVDDSAVIGPPDGSAWKQVAVPGNWTLQDVADQRGVVDLPHYTNVRMPFAGPPPSLPERNPTGVYRRPLNVPKAWAGRRVVLHIGGAESVHAIYVNGEFAGYGTDSRLASEYDLTDVVTPGRNDLAVVVWRWSAHSYVEDQDQWWMAGLHRDVWVESRAATRITALHTDAAYNHISGAGRLSVRTTVGGPTAPGRGWSVRTTLEDLDGVGLAEPQTATVPHRFVQPHVFTGHHVDATIDVPRVEPWSVDTPARYRVLSELLDPDGAVVEVHTQLVGFRSIEIRDRQFTVNGRPIWFFGVNRHDHHPDRGKAVTVDDMRDDLLAMRRHNITAVRTSHYPNDPRLLDLADEIGLFVVDEANVESHAYNTSLCNDDRYRSAWIERVARMVARDRNHPSIVMWSLGNESGHGSNHAAAAAWVRSTDPTRPLHYEGAVFHDGWIDGGRRSTDVVCPMYPSIDDIVAYGRDPRGDRPLIMCEYSHAMGNSNGSLADYWDVITSTPGLQGGFIWEWKDHGLTARLPNGTRGFAYGGQVGETVHDGNFVADGIMSADLVPHPGISEVQWVYRPVTVEPAGRSKLTITNRRSHADVSDLAGSWWLTIRGERVADGDLDVELGPLDSVTIPLPCAVPVEPDVQLAFEWRQRSATPWAPAGHLVAWDQVELRAPKRVKLADLPATTGSFDVGTIEPTLSILRAPTDNDGFKLMPELTERFGIGGRALVHWRSAEIDRHPADELVEHAHRVDPDDRAARRHGVVHRHTVVVPDEFDDLARVGVTFELPEGFDRIRWYGRGPGENYPDRNRGSMLEVWESDIDRQPYLVPQEFGVRTDCRWFEFIRSSTGETVRLDVVVPTVLHVSATHHRDADLYAAVHETELTPSKRLIVHVDVAHRGLGTASCGPDVLPRDEIPPGRHAFAYRLSARDT